MRANLAGAVVVLGSATPSLESYHNAQSGKYSYLQLESRIGNRPLASAELIDMRDVFRRSGKDVVVSPQLAEAIEATHAKGEQTIILLNRRGFSQFVLCRSCGERLRCKNCDITLTYHRGESKLVCHYCGFTANTPRKCPFCASEYLYFIGQGTEQVEDILQKRFPQLRIARIDRDTMSKRGQMAKTLLAFDAGEIDMLVGTQMLAKGHDFHNVTLVGVISVDIGLGLPDFRSAERTFQILTQVAGRAGRGNLRGRVLIQTYYPEHYALRHACRQDYAGFYDEEIRFRKQLSYPPFVVLASILVKNRDEATALRNANIVRNSLDAANADKGCRILGAAPASIARLKNEYRMQILIKSASRKALRETLEIGLHLAEENGADLRHVYTEIDPMNLM
jgi:primosomal protein N' (replication factor Y)